MKKILVCIGLSILPFTAFAGANAAAKPEINAGTKARILQRIAAVVEEETGEKCEKFEGGTLVGVALPGGIRLADFSETESAKCAGVTVKARLIGDKKRMDVIKVIF